jgi:hypothetical protein
MHPGTNACFANPSLHWQVLLQSDVSGAGLQVGAGSPFAIRPQLGSGQSVTHLRDSFENPHSVKV